jgi:hypothetical protein
METVAKEQSNMAYRIFFLFYKLRAALAIVRAGQRGLLVGAVAGLAVLAVGYGSDLLATRGNLHLVTDDVLLGLAIGAVVTVYEERRRRAIAEWAHVVRQSDMAVRAEIRALTHNLFELPDKHSARIMDSCARLDWWLTMLPGLSKPGLPKQNWSAADMRKVEAAVVRLRPTGDPQVFETAEVLKGSQ